MGLTRPRQATPQRGVRPTARSLREDLRFMAALRRLPWRVAVFYLRARLRARREGDAFSLVSATRPEDLATVLGLAAGARHLVELGTGTGWTTIALAIADSACEIVSFDPNLRREREGYLRLAGPGVSARIRWVAAPGVAASGHDAAVDVLYIDSSHEREATVAEFRAWEPRLSPTAVVIFDDYAHVDYPGVREAVADLELSGKAVGTLFVHRRTSSPPGG